MMYWVLLVGTIIGAAGAAAYLFDRRRRFRNETEEKTKVRELNSQTAPEDGPILRSREKMKEFEDRLDNIADKHRREG